MIANPELLGHVVFQDFPWSSYEQMLKTFNERRLPHTYCDGTLEIMTLSAEHEWIKKFLARLIESLSIEMRVRITCAGSTTLKRQLKQRGLEPDESYYVANFAAFRGIKRLNLEIHPPPDLVIEVNVTSKSLDRLEPYAQLGVSEVWQWENNRVRFLKRISSKKFRTVKQSLAFPLVSSEDINRFLKQADKLEEYDVINNFIAWARQLYLRHQ